MSSMRRRRDESPSSSGPSSSGAGARQRGSLFLMALALASSSSSSGLVGAFVLPPSSSSLRQLRLPSPGPLQLQPGGGGAARVGALSARQGPPDDESLYYDDGYPNGGGGGGGGRAGGGGGASREQQRPARRPVRPPPPPQRRPGSGGGGGGGGGGRGGGGMGRGGGNVPQRDMAEIIERSGRDGPEWKRAVDLDNFGRTNNNPNQGGDYRGDHRSNRRGNYPRPPGGGGGGGGRGRGGRPVQQKKSWWTSEFNRMDGELDVPLPWWAEPRGAAAMDYGEMKVPDLKAELQRRGAKVSGTKQELVERLEKLDRAYTLTDEGFREAIVVDDGGAALPACFPETYGDEFEVSLIEAMEITAVRNFAP